MNFSLATLYVRDMRKSLKFYNELLGVPITARQPAGPGKELIFLGVEGEPNLELIPSDSEYTYSGFSIGFDVDNLPEIKAKLEAAGYPIKREINPSPALTLCFLNGPNGEEVELIGYNE